MTHVVKAGAEELIWVVVGIFWVIAQIAGGAAKKKKAPPLRQSPQGEPEGDSFSDLMRKLSGVQEFKIPEPPEPVEQAAGAVSPPRSHPVQNAVRTPHLRKKPPVQKSTPVVDLSSVALAKEEEIERIAEVDIRPTMSAFRNTLPSMKLPSMKMSFQTSDPRYSESAFGDAERPKSTRSVSKIGKIINPSDKQSLRRAMLSHIIFSPPKALEEMK